MAGSQIEQRTTGWRARRSTAGMRKASVLPVPVLALASTSRPVSATGIAASCTSDVYV